MRGAERMVLILLLLVVSVCLPVLQKPGVQCSRASLNLAKKEGRSDAATVESSSCVQVEGYCRSPVRGKFENMLPKSPVPPSGPSHKENAMPGVLFGPHG